MLHGRAVVPGAARAMRPNASSARRPRSARGPVAHGTSTRQNRGMPAWLLCRRERPARRDDGHDGGAGARVGPPGVHRLRDVGDGRAVALRRARGRALRSVLPTEQPRVLAMAYDLQLPSYTNFVYIRQVGKGIAKWTSGSSSMPTTSPWVAWGRSHVPGGA